MFMLKSFSFLKFNNSNSSFVLFFIYSIFHNYMIFYKNFFYKIMKLLYLKFFVNLVTTQIKRQSIYKYCRNIKYISLVSQSYINQCFFFQFRNTAISPHHRNISFCKRMHSITFHITHADYSWPIMITADEN